MKYIGESVDLLACPSEIEAYTSRIEKISRVYLDLGFSFVYAGKSVGESYNPALTVARQGFLLYLEPIPNDAHSTFAFNKQVRRK